MVGIYSRRRIIFVLDFIVKDFILYIYFDFGVVWSIVLRIISRLFLGLIERLNVIMVVVRY